MSPRNDNDAERPIEDVRSDPDGAREVADDEGLAAPDDIENEELDEEEQDEEDEEDEGVF